MFTAMHELAHHILIAENGNKSARAHSQLFWATFHDLVDKAEAAGIHRPEIDADARKAIEEVREISRRIAELQRELGRALLRAHEMCEAKGLRFEDVMERRAQISQSIIKICVAACGVGAQDVGADIQAEAARQRDEGKRDAIIAAGREGKSVAQAKKAAISHCQQVKG
jgi:hypothetical protein